MYPAVHTAVSTVSVGIVANTSARITTATRPSVSHFCHGTNATDADDSGRFSRSPYTASCSAAALNSSSTRCRATAPPPVHGPPR